jgi:hypothetical protein
VLHRDRFRPYQQDGLATDKYSSLMDPFVSYEEKSYIKMSSGATTNRWQHCDSGKQAKTL